MTGKKRSGAYARIYDGMPQHAKVLGIRRAVRAEAIGTWTLCLSWSNQQLRDGFVPDYMVEELGGSEAGAAALVEVGLWRTRRGGFVFSNWSEHQSTRAEVEEKRSAAAERQRKSRSRDQQSSGHVTRDKSVSDTESSSKTQTETKTDDTTTSSSSASTTDHVIGYPQGEVFEPQTEQAITLVEQRLGLDRPHAWQVVDHIIGHSSRRVRNPAAFVDQSISNAPHEWERYTKTGALPA